MEIEERSAARLIVLDAEGRVLLFRHRDPLGVSVADRRRMDFRLAVAAPWDSMRP
jgi:hypothetical protein